MTKRSPDQPETAPRGAGRALKITMTLPERHAAYLDIMSVLIRLRHHRTVCRADLIQALVESMELSGIDFTAFASRDQIAAFVAARFANSPNRAPLPLLIASNLAPGYAEPEAPRGEKGETAGA
jgi:hypothetical protein